MPHCYKVTVDVLERYAEKFHRAEKESDHANAELYRVLASGAAEILRASDPPPASTRDETRTYILQLREAKRKLGGEKYGKYIKPIIEKLEKHFVHAK